MDDGVFYVKRRFIYQLVIAALSFISLVFGNANANANSASAMSSGNDATSNGMNSLGRIASSEQKSDVASASRAQATSIVLRMERDASDNAFPNAMLIPRTKSRISVKAPVDPSLPQVSTRTASMPPDSGLGIQRPPDGGMKKRRQRRKRRNWRGAARKRKMGDMQFVSPPGNAGLETKTGKNGAAILPKRGEKLSGSMGAQKLKKGVNVLDNVDGHSSKKTMNVSDADVRLGKKAKSASDDVGDRLSKKSKIVSGKPNGDLSKKGKKASVTEDDQLSEKVQFRNASYRIPRRRARPTLEPGTIETNVTALNSSLSVMQHKGVKGGELFCYIRGVCRLGNGRYLMPAWMEKHADVLARCGLTNTLYVLHEDFSRVEGDMGGDGRPRKVLVLKGYPRTSVNVSDEYRDMDILGAEPPRAEWHLLVADLTPRMVLGDIFLRPAAYLNSTVRWCTTKGGQRCAADAAVPRPGSLNASLLVDLGLSSVKDYKWPKGIVRLLRNGFDGTLRETDLADVYGFRFRNHASCFRSLLATNASVASLAGTGALRGDNFMYRANALSREPVLNLASQDRRRCDLKVLLMDRIEDGRIMGLKILQDALKILNVRLSRHFPTASVQAEAVYFQNVSFHEQISVMQESDIAIATNSELNANLAFLRPNATFFEILPFGVHPHFYRTLAQAFDVRYRHVSAMPDSAMFERCIEHYNDDIQEERNFLLSHWRRAALRFQNMSASNASAVADFYLPEDAADDTYGELRNIRLCAGMQRLSANVKQLAQDVMRVGMHKCGIRSETSQKMVFFK